MPVVVAVIGSIFGLGALALTVDFSPLTGFFICSFQWFLSVIQAVFATVVLVIQDTVCWILDQVLGLVVFIINGVTSGWNLSNYSLSAYISSISGVSPELLSLAAAIGFNDGLTIVLAALVIRFLLQIIPFVRFGS
jgi:hypothetical protein